MKPVRSMVILYARDWGMNATLLNEAEIKEIKAPTAWIIDWLVQETKEYIKLSHEYFDDEKVLDYRYTSTIPQETIIFKRIFSVEEIFK